MCTYCLETNDTAPDSGSYFLIYSATAIAEPFNTSKPGMKRPMTAASTKVAKFFAMFVNATSGSSELTCMPQDTNNKALRKIPAILIILIHIPKYTSLLVSLYKFISKPE